MGLRDCTGPAVNIFDGEAVTINGTVSELVFRNGLKIDNGTEVVTVYGIGPFWYWDQLDVDRPVVGDQVSVNAYNVTYSDGSVRTIAVSLTVGDEEIALRDQDTGAPLWRNGTFTRGQGSGKGVCPWTQSQTTTEDGE